MYDAACDEVDRGVGLAREQHQCATPVRGREHVFDLAVEHDPVADRPERLGIDLEHRAGPFGDHDASAVVGVRDAANGAVRDTSLGDQFASSPVPDPQEAVRPRGGELSTVGWSPVDTRVAVPAGNPAAELTGGDVPKLHRVTPATPTGAVDVGDGLAVGRRHRSLGDGSAKYRRGDGAEETSITANIPGQQRVRRRIEGG